MLAYIIRRLWQMIPTMLGVVLLIFSYLTGSVEILPIFWQEKCRILSRLKISETVRCRSALLCQLWIFIKQILTFDYGASWSTGESVSQIISTRLGPSLTLLIPLTILQTVISIILALAASAWQFN
jgi:peptide/nickel transport system permease protein